MDATVTRRTIIGICSLLLTGMLVVAGQIVVEDPFAGTMRGYAPVQGGQSSMFYWFFPTHDTNPDAPLILWLEGGPGDPGLLGVFFGPGPFRLNSTQRFETQPLFLDEFCQHDLC